MKAERFIANKLKFHGKISMATVAIASFIIIISVAISSGFRKELRTGLASISGDIQITSHDLNFVSEDNPIKRYPAFLHSLDSIAGVSKIEPTVYRAGIVKASGSIHGVMFKGVQGGGDSLNVSIPLRLAKLMDLGEGDDMLTYFVGERVKVRKFHIKSVYNDILSSDENLIVFAGLGDMQRLNGWDENEVSALEIILDHKYSSQDDIMNINDEVGAAILFNTPEDEDTMVATSAVRRYPQIFAWLDLIDFNVLFVLILMIVVAGFNMVSSLLIVLFRNISVIGTLKSLGMTDRSISEVFLRTASSAVLKGMLIGNALALLFCLLQSNLHIIKLNPENYFVSSVPIHLDLLQVLAADVVSYLLIMAILMLPCLFVSRVDPAKTVRAQ